MRPITTLMLIAAVVALSSCSVGWVRHDPGAGPPLTDFIGIWRGTSTSSLNGAKVKISFLVERNDDHFKGTYRCAPYNANCRNNIQRGWLRGQTIARTFKVEMQDTSWCLFTLAQFFPPLAGGDYTCYSGGSIVDQGTFQLKGPPGIGQQQEGHGATPRQ